MTDILTYLRDKLCAILYKLLLRLYASRKSLNVYALLHVPITTESYRILRVMLFRYTQKAIKHGYPAGAALRAYTAIMR